MTLRSSLRFASLWKAGALGLALMTSLQQANRAEDWGLESGSVELTSAGPLTFGPDGILFVADPLDASIIAIDTQGREGNPNDVTLNVEGLSGQVAGLLGIPAADMILADMAVNPLTGDAYLSVARGREPDAEAVLIKVSTDNQVSIVDLSSVSFAQVAIPNPPAEDAVDRRGTPQRTFSVTDLAYIKGQVVIAGLSNEEFSSTLRAITFPFGDAGDGASVEIYHGAHGRFETDSPVRTLAPITISGEPFIVAAYTCTPLVKFSVADLKDGERLRGTTVAELGNRNRPLDMIVYSQDDHEYILMANSARGVMKIDTAGIDQAESISEPVEGTAGQPYETIEGLSGVMHLDRLNDTCALVVIQKEDQSWDLSTIKLP